MCARADFFCLPQTAVTEHLPLVAHTCCDPNRATQCRALISEVRVYRERRSSPVRDKFGCVCSYMAGHISPGVRLQIWVCSICVISPYSKGAVQIRVGLELSELRSCGEAAGYFRGK